MDLKLGLYIETIYRLVAILFDETARYPMEYCPVYNELC